MQRRHQICNACGIRFLHKNTTEYSMYVAIFSGKTLSRDLPVLHSSFSSLLDGNLLRTDLRVPSSKPRSVIWTPEVASVSTRTRRHSCISRWQSPRLGCLFAFGIPIFFPQFTRPTKIDKTEGTPSYIRLSTIIKLSKW